MPGVARRDRPLKRAGAFSELDGLALSGETLGDLIAYDGSDFTNTKSLTGDYAVTGTWQATDIIVDDDLTVGDDLTVTGLATIGETLSVAGATTLSGAATLESTLDVTGAATLSDDLTVAGALSGAGFSFSGSGTVAGDLDVTGALSAGSLSLADLSLTGDLSVAGGLGVEGDASLIGDVIVGGQLTSGTALAAPIIGGADGSFSDTLTLGGSSVITTSDSIGDVSDVILATVASGDLLRHDGTTWVNFPESSLALDTSNIATGTFADARIAESNVTQHEAALSITESQISDLQSYLLDITGESVGDLSDVTLTSPSTGEVLYYDGSGWANTGALSVDPAGAAVLKYNGLGRVETTSSGVTLTGTVSAGNLAVNNSINLSSGGLILGTYGSGDTDITSLVPSSTFGSLIEGDAAGHLVVGIRGNDDLDGFHVIDTNNLGTTTYARNILSATGAGVTLYDEGGKALETDSNGIRVHDPDSSGTTTLQLYQGGTLAIAALAATGSSTIRTYPNGVPLRLQGTDNSGSAQFLLVGDPDGSLDLYYAGTKEAGTASGAFAVTNDLTVGGDATVTGDLTIEGTGDNIVLNSDETGSPTDDAGLYVERGTSSNSHLKWDETNDYWELNAAGSAIIQAGASTLGFFGTTPASQASAYTPTNVTTDRSFDADTVAVAELADVVGTLISDLQAYGLLQ